MADLLYLDYNCFQRGFDDPRQIRIQMEALACEEIFVRAEQDEPNLIWSFMHYDETLLCPFPERKYAVLRLATLCKTRLGPGEQIHRLALSFQQRGRLGAKDSIHLACAQYAKADFFLTCDDRLTKQVESLNLRLRVTNPVDYVRLERTRGQTNDDG